jgi:hypothetical protein
LEGVKLATPHPEKHLDSFAPWISIGLQLIFFTLLFIFFYLLKNRVEAEKEETINDLKHHLTDQLKEMEKNIKVINTI